MLAKVTSIEIGKNRDGDNKVLLLQAEITDPEDVQTIEAFRGVGEDYNPPSDSRVVYLAAGNAYKIAIAIDDGVEPDPSIEEGERELYSSVAVAGVATRKAKHRFKKDGKHVFNDGADWAVRFSVLEEAFNQLLDDHNSLVDYVNKKLVPHTHTAPTGATSTPLPPIVDPALPSFADITDAKVEEIMIPEKAIV
jgi:hypothetical protein